MRNNCGFYSARTPLKVIKSVSTVNHQQVIVCFKGQTFICDSTELQARALILFATREFKEKKSEKGSNSDLILCMNCLQSQVYGSPGLSIKRSLKSFLQNKRQRNQASSPYNQ